MHQGLSVKEFEDGEPDREKLLQGIREWILRQPKRFRFDLGLNRLSEITNRGETWTLDEIAYACDCTYEWVRKKQVQALSHLKRELRHQTGTLNDEELKQLIQDICQSCDAQAQDARTFFRTDTD